MVASAEQAPPSKTAEGNDSKGSAFGGGRGGSAPRLPSTSTPHLRGHAKIVLAEDAPDLAVRIALLQQPFGDPRELLEFDDRHPAAVAFFRRKDFRIVAHVLIEF